MSSMTQTLGISLADLRQRSQGSAFSAAVLFALLLAYAVAAGKLRLLAGHHEGALDTAWIASMLSMTVSTLIAFVGFYIVNNAIALDVATGVHRVLAACPVSRLAYCFGKWLSSTALLMTIVFALFASALAVQSIRADVNQGDAIATLALVIGIALPMMALVASCALLFETLPFLRGGTGNILWMPCFVALLSGAVAMGRTWNPILDISGLELVRAHLVQCVSSVDTQYDGAIALTFVGHGSYKTIACSPMTWNLQLMMQRFALVGASALIVLIAAWRFDHFSVRDGEPLNHKRPKMSMIRRIVGTGAFARQLTLEELRLMVLEGGMAWPMGVVILTVVALLVPIHAIDWVLLGAWLLPALPLSRLGCRENRHGVRDLLATVPTSRLIASRWVAAFIALTGSAAGVIIRHAAEGNLNALWAIAASAGFVASLAIACGAVARSEKLFQVVYVGLIYLGPVNGVVHWNFVSTQDTSNPGRWMTYAVVALCMAVVGRRVQNEVRKA